MFSLNGWWSMPFTWASYKMTSNNNKIFALQKYETFHNFFIGTLWVPKCLIQFLNFFWNHCCLKELVKFYWPIICRLMSFEKTILRISFFVNNSQTWYKICFKKRNLRNQLLENPFILDHFYESFPSWENKNYRHYFILYEPQKRSETCVRLPSSAMFRRLYKSTNKWAKLKNFPKKWTELTRNSI